MKETNAFEKDEDEEDKVDYSQFIMNSQVKSVMNVTWPFEMFVNHTSSYFPDREFTTE